MPLVSVITPFHLADAYLTAAVRSIQAQTLADFEHLIVDHGTGMDLAALGPAGADPRLRLVRQPPAATLADCLNAGIAAARGEFIALLDRDDLALPHRLERQVAALRARPACGLVAAAAADIDAAGRVLGRRFTLLEPAAHRTFLRYAPPATTSTYTGRRELFATLRYRPEYDFAPDYDFYLRAAEVTDSCALPEVLVHYRVHAGQATQRHLGEQVLHACQARLNAARRGRGAAESTLELAYLRAGAPDGKPGLAATYRHFAWQSLAEGFADLAVYHARKLLAADRSPAAIAAALGVVARALGAQPRRAGFLLRLFGTGPLRTHGLRPAT